MTLKKVYCYDRKEDLLVNPNNITYVEFYLKIYKVHMNDGNLIILDKYGFKHLRGGFQ